MKNLSVLREGSFYLGQTESMELIQNKVADSGLKVLDPADFLPEMSVVSLDISQFLWQGMVLREKDFREQLKHFDWVAFTDKFVAIDCSTDAIVPRWAYMLIAQYLLQHTPYMAKGSAKACAEAWALAGIAKADFEEFRDEKVILKGCGDDSLSDALYVALTARLQPLVKSLMYGEPCSTVPVYKKK